MWRWTTGKSSGASSTRLAWGNPACRRVRCHAKPRTCVKLTAWHGSGPSSAIRSASTEGRCSATRPAPCGSDGFAPDDDNRIPLACRGALIEETSGRLVLFETGIGAFFSPKLRERYGVVEAEHVLERSLTEAGFSHADIDVVVLSHLHFDHAGGLLAAWEENQPMRLLFPKARFVVGRRAWDRARTPHPRDRASFIAELPGLLEASGRLELVDDASPTLGASIGLSSPTDTPRDSCSPRSHRTPVPCSMPAT